MSRTLKCYFISLQENSYYSTPQNTLPPTTPPFAPLLKMGRDMKEYMEKLRKVGVAVGAQLDGANEVKDEPEVDMSQWTEYEKGRYQVTKRMSEIREDLSSLQEMEKGGDTTKKTHLSNKVRKNIRAMKAEASSLKAEAEKSQKLPEYDELIKHMKKTEKLHTQRYRPKNAREDDDGLGALGGGGFDTGREMRSIQDLTDPSNPQGDLTESLLDPAEDEEFQMFYQGVKQRDQEIDAGYETQRALIYDHFDSVFMMSFSSFFSPFARLRCVLVQLQFFFFLFPFF